MGRALRGLLVEDRDEFLWPKASKSCTKIETIQIVLLASTSNSGTSAAEGGSSKRMHSFLHSPLLGQVPWQNPMEKAHLNPAQSVLSDKFQFSKGEHLARCKQDPRNPSDGWTCHSLHAVPPHQFAILTSKVVTNLWSCFQVCFLPFCSYFWYLKTIWTSQSSLDQRISCYVAALSQVWFSHLN